MRALYTEMSGLSAIKEMLAFQKTPLDRLQKISQTSQILGLSIFTKKFPLKSVYFFLSPDATRELMKEQKKLRRSRSVYKALELITGKRGLVQQNNKEGKDLRKNLDELFSVEGMKPFYKAFSKNAEKAISEIEKDDFLQRYTLRNAFQLTLGLEANSELLELESLFVELNAICGDKLRTPCPYHLYKAIQQNKRAKKLSLQLRTAISKALKQRNPNINCRANELDKSGTSQEETIDHICTFLFAGYETTASFLELTLLELSKDKELQKKIINEVQNNDLKAMIQPSADSALKKLYNSVLRRYPPSYMLARESNEELSIQLENRTISIPKNSLIFIGLRETQLETGPFLAFGHGDRICIGIHASYFEASLLIREILNIGNFKSYHDSLQFDGMITSRLKNRIQFSIDEEKANEPNQHYAA